MDRVLPKKTWTTRRIAAVSGIAGIILLIAASYYFTSGKSRLNVEAERITISEIKNGTFQEFISVNGVVMPLTTIYLDALEGGRVEEKFVEDGAFLKKGDPIMRLSNNDMELALINQETSVFGLLTQMQISRTQAQQNTISKLNQMADVDNAFKEAERVYNLNKRLYEQKAISLQEFNQSQIAYDYQVKRKKFTGQILQQDSISTRHELDQTRQSYERSQNALALMKKKVGDLIVRAPVDGQLTSFDSEIGQSKGKSERLGQIDVVSGFKARVDIDEHYISRVFTGLEGEVTLAGKTYKLRIRKVYTQVISGRFQVDMEFAGDVPKDVRRGQTLQIRLTLSDEKQALLLPRGGFYQQTGGNWIFKLNDNGTVAYKMEIQLGGQNPDYYEVLEGLQPGDKVVTSSYENYGEMEELVLRSEK